jgi:hypothetical protein
MRYNLTKDDVKSFINTTEIRGVQDISSSTNFGITPTRIAGEPRAFLLPEVQNGELSFSTLMVSSDPFIDLTGEAGVNIHLTETGTSYFSAVSGYLTSYSNSCQINRIPEINASFGIFGDMGRLSSEQTSGNLGVIFSGGYSPVESHYVGPGCIELVVNDLDTNKVISYNINISCPRRPNYILGSRFPISVSTLTPFEITCEFTISAKDYQPFPLRAYPENSRASNIRVLFKNYITSSIVNSYTFSDMTLISESRNDSVDSESKVTLKFSN